MLRPATLLGEIAPFDTKAGKLLDGLSVAKELRRA
jgi:hypothetical protein